jgi:hypothetical protein
MDDTTLPPARPLLVLVGDAAGREPRLAIEWVEYHRLIGTERMVLRIPPSDDHAAVGERLARHVRDGVLTIAPTAREEPDGYRREAGRPTWVIPLGTDEFLVPAESTDPIDALNAVRLDGDEAFLERRLFAMHPRALRRRRLAIEGAIPVQGAPSLLRVYRADARQEGARETSSVATATTSLSVHRYAPSSADAIDEGPSARCDPMAERYGLVLRAAVLGHPRVCIVVHVGYACEWPFYRPYLDNVAKAGIAFDLYVTVVEGQMTPELRDDLVSLGRSGRALTGRSSASGDDRGDDDDGDDDDGAGGHVCIIDAPNRGLDGGGWLLAVAAATERERETGLAYDVVLKVHTKSTRNSGPEWRATLMGAIAGTPERAADCVAAFVADPRLGVIGDRDWAVTESARSDVMAMAARLGLPRRPDVDARPLFFIGGTMFWARFAALSRPLAGADLRAVVRTLTPGFPRGIETDGHMLERIFGVLVARAHLHTCGVATDDPTPPWHTTRDDGRVGDAARCVSPIGRAIAAALGGAPRVGGRAHETEWAAVAEALRAADAEARVPEPISVVDATYQRACHTPGDIWQLLPVLCAYAARCDHVTECVSHMGHSTWALLRGIARGAPQRRSADTAPSSSSSSSLRMITVVTAQWPAAPMPVVDLARGVGVSYELRYGDDVATLLEETDLLFIDTWHVYAHLKRELERHHARVRRWIVMHDTAIDAFHGESIRCRADTAEQARRSGYPEAEIRRGVWPAVREFLAAHGDEWRLAQRWNNCNGLAILARIAAGS